MSKIALSGNASGTGTFTFAAPGTNTDRTLTLPDAAGTLATTADIPSVNPFTLGTAVASTSGTAIDFTGIPSWAKRVTVMLNGVSFASNPSIVIMRLGTSSGVDASSGYAAAAGNVLLNSATGSFNFNTTEFFLNGNTGTMGSDTTFFGQAVLSLLNGTTWALSGCIGGSTPSLVASISGTKTLSGTLDRLRISSSAAATFDAGTINISYEG